MNRQPLTQQGAQKLREELRRLKQEERPKATRAIAEARAHGDLGENAEYHAAREQQSFLEGRIQKLEQLLSSAEIIRPASLGPQERVVFGSTVALLETETERKHRYRIVGEMEADINQNLLSVNSPIARALIGHTPGEEVSVQTPGGEVYYEILEILIEN